jgi:hypothetical protein
MVYPDRSNDQTLGRETRAIIQAIQQQRGKSRDRFTHSQCIQVQITPTLLLKRNKFRISYFIQNLDGANYVGVAPQGTVAVALLNTNEGSRILAGDWVFDDDDTDEVWAVASIAPVYVVIREVSERIGGN